MLDTKVHDKHGAKFESPPSADETLKKTPTGAFRLKALFSFSLPSFHSFTIHHRRIRSSALYSQLDNIILQREPHPELPLKPVLSTLFCQQHRPSLAIKTLSTLPIHILLAHQCSKKHQKSFIFWNKSTLLMTLTGGKFINAPSSALQSLSSSSTLEGTTSESLEDPPTKF